MSDSPDSTSDVVAEKIIRLLEERLIVDRSKRKVGEVIVRKVVETRTVEVPLRREKLIVEQISPEHKQLVEIDLGQGEITGDDLFQAQDGSQSEKITGVELAQVTSSVNEPTVSGEFTSLKAASSVLDAIALQDQHRCKKVRIELVLEDSEHQAAYQGWFDRCSDVAGRAQ